VKDRDIVKEDVFWGKDPNNLSVLETSAVSSTAWQECHQDHDGDQGQDVGCELFHGSIPLINGFRIH
jgi:hypothetical protein